MKSITSRSLLTILSLVLLSSCSQEVPTEVTPQPLEVVTGPFLIRDGIRYHQDTNELVTGIVEEFHENGQLRDKSNFKDGVLDGLNEYFHENGQLLFRANYRDGKPDGLHESFHGNGQLRDKSNFKDGVLDGLRESFHGNGQLKETGNFQDGKREGIWESFDEGGQLLNSVNYRERTQTPQFDLPRVLYPEQRVKSTDYAGKIALVNFWATWCVGCLQEREFLMELSRGGMPIYGIVWRDRRELAIQSLETRGDPYVASGFDGDAIAGTDIPITSTQTALWGVTGAPETFLIGRDGSVLYQHLGQLTSEIFVTEFIPLIKSDLSAGL
jgi:cytochrome c biogenesis protein CcmG/thiol:disulfide interchange protein DsbE